MRREGNPTDKKAYYLMYPGSPVKGTKVKETLFYTGNQTSIQHICSTVTQLVTQGST